MNPVGYLGSFGIVILDTDSYSESESVYDSVNGCVSRGGECGKVGVFHRVFHNLFHIARQTVCKAQEQMFGFVLTFLSFCGIIYASNQNGRTNGKKLICIIYTVYAAA